MLHYALRDISAGHTFRMVCLAFADLVRTRLPALSLPTITKTYHACGEENELGEFALMPVSLFTKYRALNSL